MKSEILNFDWLEIFSENEMCSEFFEIVIKTCSNIFLRIGKISSDVKVVKNFALLLLILD